VASVDHSIQHACLSQRLAEDARRRDVLGPDVAIRLHTFDETNRRVHPRRIIRDIKRNGGRALIALVGVQTNQFPRAVDLACPFLAAGMPVCVGGFHVSGCIAMLPELPTDIRAAQAMGISLFAGEAEEGRLDAVLRDAWAGRLQPIYNFMDSLPSLEGEPPPILPRKHVRRTSGSLSSADLGRGCPYQCSFCTIINVQGRKSRFRSPDDLERIIRENYVQGIKRFFITDDNFARNRHWEALSDRMIQLRLGEGLKIGFTIQVDTLCHRIPRPGTALSTILWFTLMIMFEGVHPLEGGALRLKFRRDRRSGLKLENPWVFYPRLLAETLGKAWGYYRVFRQAKTILKEVLAAPDRWTYRDLAITPQDETEFDNLDLYHATDGGADALTRKRREDAIRERVRPGTSVIVRPWPPT
jgi:hypothetical protein